MKRSPSTLRNHRQLHRALDALKDDGVIHGWGRDRFTCRYVVALSEEGRRSGLTIGDA